MTHVRALLPCLALCLAILTPPRAVADPVGPAGMSLAFSDEFDRPALAGGPWKTEFHSGARVHGDEIQAYLPDEGPGTPFEVRDGVLRISLRPASPPEVPEGLRYASGMLSSHADFTFLYGRAEARIRIPAGKGLWPAFWMFSPAEGRYSEIDIMENLGDDPRKVYATTHSGPKWDGRRIDQAETPSDEPYSEAFHVYAVDWDANGIAFSIDGRVTGRFDTTPELRHPMHLLLNLAAGGEWSGPPDASTPMPAVMEIDYVRVWQARE